MVVVYTCMQFYLCVRSPLKFELPEDANQSHLERHQSKPHPNAAARTHPKWNVCQRMTLGLLFRMEAGDYINHYCKHGDSSIWLEFHRSGMNCSGSSHNSGEWWIS